MKASVGVDADSGLVHSMVTTAASESNVSQAHALLYGREREREAFSGAGYIGVDGREDMKGKTVKWRVPLRRGKIKAMPEDVFKELVIAAERTQGADSCARPASIPCRHIPRVALVRTRS